MADDTEKKATVVDVTAEATEKAKKEEKIENKANDYKSFWEGINENERKMSNDTPNFHIYISHEKMDIYSEEIEEMDAVDRKSIIKKYGHYDGTLGESTDFGSVTPLLVCVNLLVDDGNESRSNRKLMFREDYKDLGVACVPHDDLGCITLIMYSTDFAEGAGKPDDDDE